MLTTEQTAQVAEFIDTDGIHWANDEGAFRFQGGSWLFYSKTADIVILECEGIIYEVERFEFTWL